MRHDHTAHTTQICTPFGSGYVPEAHGQGASFQVQKKHSGAKWAAIIAGLLIGETTTAGAYTAARKGNPIPKLWLQPAPTLLLKLPDVPTAVDPVF